MNNQDDPFDYDVIRNDDGTGELYIGNIRVAEWTDIEPGQTKIILSNRDSDQWIGYAIQSEKAPDVCRAWITESRLSRIVINWQKVIPPTF